MSDIKITREQWDDAVVLFKRYKLVSPYRVARKIGCTVETTTRLYDDGIPGLYPPIKQVVAELRAAEAAKAAENPPLFNSVEAFKPPGLHVTDTPRHTHNQAHTHVHTLYNVETAPLPESQPSPPKPAAAPLQPSPSEPTSLQIGDSAADLAKALDIVHRDLAAALPRESMLVRALREQAVGTAGSATLAVQTANKLIARLCEKITRAVARDEIEERRGFVLITKLLKITTTASKQAKEAFELQRLIAGLPQSITAEISPGKPADRIADLAAITERLEAIQSARRSKVIDVDATPYRGEESGGD